MPMGETMPKPSHLIAFILGAAPWVRAVSAAEMPEAIAAKGETAALQVHAEGAQIYECKADAGGKLAWQFREPIASLFSDGKTVGRHYAGPNWEIGGGAVAAKGVGRAPGASPKDVPWLKLEVTEHRGSGPLDRKSTRLNSSHANISYAV